MRGPGEGIRSDREQVEPSLKGASMRTLWVVILGLAALTAMQGCKRKDPQPIPGPKAVHAIAGHARAAGIAWFQGSLDEAFAKPELHRTCAMERGTTTPLVPEPPRSLNRQSSPAPAPCRTETCQPLPYPRRPLV